MIYQHADDDAPIAAAFSKVISQADKDAKNAAENPTNPEINGTSMARNHLRLIQ